MTHPVPNESALAGIGAVVIGRNEGERLRLALASVPEAVDVVYVDSGSTDGSVEFARLLGVEVHSLDASLPFTPARGRREGVQRLMERSPGVRWIQFLDGDCEIDPQWLERAVDYLQQHGDVGVVCGGISECEPQRSIYNRLNDLQLKAPAGEIQACGGIFLVRREVYEKAGGFDERLITREESDLCGRVRAEGYRVIRLDAPMAKHDAGLLRFGQWWSRAIWGGYGDAVGMMKQQSGRLSAADIRRIGRYLGWPCAVPMLAVAGLIAAIWFPWFLLVPLGCLASYGVPFLGVYRYRLSQGDAWKDAALFSIFRILRRFGTTFGFLLYFMPFGSKNRPDPHRPEGRRATSATDNTGATEAVASARTP